jgi:dynein heavy chain
MNLEDLIILSAMGPPGGGRTFITNRMVRHYNILAYTELDFGTIESIFIKLTEFFFNRFSGEIKDQLCNLVKATL